MEELESHIFSHSGRLSPRLTDKHDSISLIGIQDESILFNNGWNDKNERILINLGENAAAYKWMHEKSHIFYGTINKITTVFSLLLSTSLSVESTINFNICTTEDKSLEIFKKAGIYLVAIITAIQQFLQYEGRSEAHFNHSAKFSAIYTDIQQKLSVYRRDRGNAQQYLSKKIKEYDSTSMSGPGINSIIIYQLKRTFKGIRLPIIADNIENIEVIPEISQDNLGNLSNLENMNACMRIQGDNDKDVQAIPMEAIKKLNGFYINNKKGEYEYDRFINGN